MIRKIAKTLAVGLALVLGANHLATASYAQVSATQTEGKSFLVADVLKLLQIGLDEEVVVAKIRKEGKSFDLSAEDFVELKKAGATSSILKAMINPMPTPVQSASSIAQPSGLPDEQGVYLKVKGEWKAIEPEIVNTRTANMLGAAFSYGISKAKLKGDIEGTRSKVQIAGPVEILIKCADGTAASEYNIVKMEEKSGRREFEAAQMGMVGAKGGVRKGVVTVKFEKIAKATYTGVLNNVARGEYGVLPPGAATSATTASAGKIYAFGITE